MARERWLDVGWFLLVVATSSFAAFTAGQRLGATFDEPAHIDAGLKCWRSGSYKPLMRWGAMPLPIDVQTLPIYLWERYRGEPFEPYLQMHELIPVARAASLPFWWLLLFYGSRWGRLLGGPWAGRLACGFLATDPNLLGHAALATTDLCLTATVLMATFHFFTNRESGWWWRVFVPGLLYGVALTAKASALPYVPLLGLVFGIYHLIQTGQWTGGRDWRKATARLRWDLVTMMAIGFVYLFAYCGCDWATEPSFIAWAHSLPEGPNRDAMVTISERLCIFTNGGEGLVQQIKHNMRGHDGTFVAGELHPKAVWYYYPVALSIKLADPTLLLLLAVLVIRPRALLTPAGWAVLVLLIFSLNTRVQIGVRLVFPLVAFLHLALAVAVCRASDNGRFFETPLNVLRVFAMLCVVGCAVECATVWPDGVRFTNQLWGSTDRGHERLADSNYDWGQGLPELAEWQREHADRPLFVWYYGGDPAVLKSPFVHLPVHLMPQPGVGEVKQQVGNGYFAVSLTLLSACPDRRPEVVAVIDWLKGRTPVAHTGTFFIYDLREAP